MVQNQIVKKVNNCVVCGNDTVLFLQIVILTKHVLVTSQVEHEGNTLIVDKMVKRYIIIVPYFYVK